MKGRIELSGPRSWAVIEEVFSGNEEVTALLTELKESFPEWAGMSPWVWKVSA